ncbi:hypothetical protein INS49_012718 [Diaporthe citri]|uniref:uncharacterized protein n=1 Tax=Diaporthe citri TaxID=83186 RepID=UPI001C7F3F56|nr:uncharacterized protein INS49_012718 [Diaporthe citri]KAG6359198.1 hypothetical protein INS49_012718 [Diaporthe citri]
MIRPNHALHECPFCGGFPEEVEKDSSKWDHESALGKLEKHVKDHLVSVALILAPMEREEPAGQFDETQSEAQRGDQSERDSNGVGDQYELECSNALCDCKTRSDLELEQNISSSHDAREDVQAFWDSKPLWKQIQEKKVRDHQSDPLPLELLQQSLLEYINNSLRESEFPTPKNGYFAPRSTLRAIHNASVTRTIWPDSESFESLDDSDRKVVEFISGDAPEIFAIGIYMDVHDQSLRDMMRLFMRHDISDRSLPISDAEMGAIWPGPRHNGRRRLFKNSQHLFRPQCLPMRDRLSVIQLQPNVVLPILKSEHTSQGQFGIVYKVRLHEEFLDFNDPIRKAHGVAAIKELRESIEDKNAKRAWEREVKTLQKICQLDLPHVVDIAAMIAIGKKQYFVFPWADGGNLLNLWKSRDSHHDRSIIARRHIPDIVDQLVGLAGALTRLHAFRHGNSDSYRHGDLKPENILIFDSKNHNSLGVWKMADLGLARHHFAATGDRRPTISNAGSGTISYQPPETINAKSAPTSRLYDIWSMGCIMLQLMTWLLYGTRKVDELTRDTKSVFAKDQSSYWIASWNETRGYHNINVHPSVKTHMAQMKRDIEGSKALQDLLSIIQDKLLVVQLPETTMISRPGCRTNAADLHHTLKAIQAACEDQRYWFSGANVVKQTSHLQLPQGQNLGVERGNKLNDTWEKAADKTFVLTLLGHPELRDSIVSDAVPKAKLCMKCENMDFFAEKLQITDTFQELRRDAALCDFCKMRWHLGKDLFSHEVQSILFDLVDSDLQLNHRPVISFLACHEDSERALARRTIFFTEKQTYWECGTGVRCETAMNMNKFPEVAMRFNRGGKIRLFQDLYSNYSRLGLSHDADRPVAIAGIEKRLISSLEVRGGFGVLDDGNRGLLWRSLLWQRARDAPSGLKRIEFELLKGVAVAIIPPPSWSWMTYKGAIDYMDLPFNEVDWEEKDIWSRWSRGTGNSWSYSGDFLTANIVLDDPDRTDELESFLKCVVLGRLKGQEKESSDARTHYVLLVTPVSPQGQDLSLIYNRVGVGYMPGGLIDFSEQGTPGELR